MAALLGWSKGSSVSLFERIQESDEPKRSHSPEYLTESLVNSIKRHLNNVLNSRPGGCQSSIDLGVIDLNDATMTTRDLKSTIQASIGACIERYEPRLSNVTVSPIVTGDDPLELRFKISADIYLESEKHVVAFDLLLDGSQHYQLV